MLRWLAWIAVGLIVYVGATVIYTPEFNASRETRWLATLAFRGWVVTTGVALCVATVSWLLRGRQPN